MKLRFIGAAHEVTGSCTLLSTDRYNILIDCGMEQGKDIFVNAELGIKPETADMVFLTHAHIDHSGKLPLLASGGFDGPIYATEGTAELCRIMLRDSAHIQAMEAQWKNRKAQRAGQPESAPMYSMEDAEKAISQLVVCRYGKKTEIAPGLSAEFFDAGHLLGSASIRLTVEENGESTEIVFSGDIGNAGKPILRDPQCPGRGDIVVMESTYGDRVHPTAPDYIASLSAVLNETFARGGNVVIPSFAVGRTQELLYFLRQIRHERLVKEPFKVYLDSPLALKATNVFNRNTAMCCDAETANLIAKGINPISFDGLITTESTEESKAINDTPGCKVIISSSGMCDAGRIRHHLKHNLWRSDSSVLFVGYQSPGTLGRRLLDGEKNVRIFGEEIQVNARIYTLAGISGHADMNGLMRWIKGFEGHPRVFINHGEEKCADELTARLTDAGFDASAPYSGDEYSLPDGTQVAFGSRELVISRKRPDFASQLEAALDMLRQRIFAKDTSNEKVRQSLLDKIKEFARKI